MNDVASLIVALTGAVGLLAGLFAGRQGRKDTRTDAAAAHVLAERVQGWNELAALNDRLVAEISRKDAVIERLIAERNRAEVRADAAEAQLRGRRPDT